MFLYHLLFALLDPFLHLLPEVHVIDMFSVSNWAFWEGMVLWFVGLGAHIFFFVCVRVYIMFTLYSFFGPSLRLVMLLVTLCQEQTRSDWTIVLAKWLIQFPSLTRRCLYYTLWCLFGLLWWCLMNCNLSFFCSWNVHFMLLMVLRHVRSLIHQHWQSCIPLWASHV